MRATIVALGVVMLSSMSGHRRASASCAYGGTSIGTPAGISLPPRGVLYTRGVWRTFEIESLGAWARGTVVQAARERGHEQVSRYEYVAWAGPMLVSIGGPSLVYEVNPGWTAPAAAPRVVSLTRDEFDGCPGFHGVSIELDQPVAAVRVRWRAPISLAALTVVPSGGTSLFLGEHACSGESFPVRLLREGISFELIAIRYDGSEIPIDGVPDRLVLDEIAPSQAFAVQRPGWINAALRPTPRSTPKTSCWWLDAPAALLVVLLAGLRRPPPRPAVPS